MPYVIALLLVAFLVGCGPNKELASEKFDPPLKERVALLNPSMEADSLEGDTPEEVVEDLMVVGTCDTTINGAMRNDLESSGAQNLVMKGREFTAKVSSDRIYDVADLEFVRELRLQKGKKAGKK